ncbi:MAG: hypothetical protein AAF085_08830, partial [Planctomycetota bacterium]
MNPIFWLALGGIVLLVVIVVTMQPKPKQEKHPEQRKRAEKGLGKDIEALAFRLRTNVAELRRFEPVYRKASIPK